VINNISKAIERGASVVDYYFHESRKPITKLFSKIFISLHINQSHITAFRFVLLIAFLPLWIYEHYNVAITFLAINILLDIIDGDLARILNTDSDIRKFEDVMADNIMVVVLPLALIWQGLISGFLGGYYLFIVTLSWWLSVVKRNFVIKSNWLFRAQASFLLFVTRFCVVTLLMFIYVIFGVEIFSPAIITLSVILTLSSAYDYYQIIKAR
jgi:phosphatidylglycerophosphate synthase